MNNNPANFNDPSGHTIACGLDYGYGCAGSWLGGLTPSQILYADVPDELKNKAIYNYTLSHPDYNYVVDDELEDTGKFLVSNAIFLGNADYISRQPNLIDRIKATWNSITSSLALSFAAFIAGGNTWSLDDLSLGAALPDRNGLTYAGRSLQKHGNRSKSAFPKTNQNPSVLNSEGQMIVDEILTNPGSIIKQYTSTTYGDVIDVIAPDGRGLRFDANSGRLIGFLEP